MAGNVYDLPSTEQGIKWMHAVCGYPVKSTWLKAIAAGNFIGWPLLTVQNVKKYYPETSETPKGHLNQTRKNVRSTKEMETHDTSLLKGKKDEISAYMSTMSERQYFPIKQESTRNVRKEGTNTYGDGRNRQYRHFSGANEEQDG
jgi:hypothetical protein